MRWLKWLLLALVCCVLGAGCGSAETEKLRSQMEQLRTENEAYDTKLARLESENAQLKADLTNAEQELAKVQEIRKGYEAARAKLEENLAQLGPLLGNTGSLLPPFEDLKNSDWAGRFAPGGQLPADLKALEGQMKALLGGESGGAADGPARKQADR